MLLGLTEGFQLLRLAIENTNIALTTEYVKMKPFQVEYVYEAIPSTNSNALQAKHYSHREKKTQKKTNKPRRVKCFICEGPHKA